MARVICGRFWVGFQRLPEGIEWWSQAASLPSRVWGHQHATSGALRQTTDSVLHETLVDLGRFLALTPKSTNSPLIASYRAFKYALSNGR